MLIAEASRLESLLASLDRDWAQLPKLMGLSVLALPAGWFWGSGAAFGVVLLVFSLVATVVYLIGVRRKEYRYELDEVEALLRGSSSTES